MIRRSPLRLAAVAAATAAALSGCATFSDADVVAHVGDQEISNDEFETMSEEFFANPEVFGTTPSENGRVAAEESRSLLGAMVREEIVNIFLDQHDIDASQIRQTFKQTALAGTPVAELSDEIQNLIATIDEEPRTQAVSLADPADTDELRTMYADNPATTGVMCTRHILVETQADAESVLDELRQGADFATLAAERSIDPAAADNGGALSSTDNECIPLQTMAQSLDPDFVAGALEAREGIPSEPVESSFGWHIILHRPWDEISAAVGELHQRGDSGVLMFDGMAATTEVETDARYGTWDPVLSAVVAIG